MNTIIARRRAIAGPLVTAVTSIAALTASASADLSLPAFEGFDSGGANWFDGPGTGEADWVATGGADGGGYITSDFLLPDVPPPFGFTAFRAQDEFGSSGGIFEGDYISAGVTELRFSVRHDAPAPLTFFSRLAGPANFPGALGFVFQPVLPGQWTEVVIDLTEASPQILLEGAPYSDIFSNIGHLQFGFDTPELPAGTGFTVDLDSVALVPAPGALGLLGLAGLAGRRRRTA